MRIRSGISKLEQEKNLNNSEVICWKLYLKKLFVDDEITEQELKDLYNLPFRIDEIHEERHIEIFGWIMDAVSDDVKHEQHSSLIKMVKDDVSFILDGSIKEGFDKEWKFYLFECLNDKSITLHQYKLYKKSIDFSTPLDEIDRRLIDEILSIIRIKLIKKNPTIISDIDNPNFDMLMVANNIEI